MAKTFSLKGWVKSSASPAKPAVKKVAPTISGLDAAASGISALTTVARKDREYRQVPLTDIKAMEQVRTSFENAQLQEDIQSLAASIKVEGVQLPIILARRDPADQKYIILDGECRWRAAKIAGLEVIPAMVTNLTYSKTAEWELKQVAANLMRMPLTPMELGRSFASAVAQGISVVNLAERFGKSRGYIQNFLAINRAPQQLRDYFEKRDLRDVVTMTTLVHCVEKDAVRFAELFAPYEEAEADPISRADAKRLQAELEGKAKPVVVPPQPVTPPAPVVDGKEAEAGDEKNAKDAKTEHEPPAKRRQQSRWELSEGCHELPDVRGVCFKAVLCRHAKKGDKLFHGTLMSNIETSEVGKVVFLYEGKAIAVDPADIVRLEAPVSADKVTSSEDFEEKVGK